MRILLTHAHGDHIGSLDALAEQLPDAEVSSATRACCARQEPGRRGAAAHAHRSFPGRDGAHPHAGGGDRAAPHARPGHTPGMIALLDERDGTLICGDAFSTLGGVATSAKANPRFPLPALATWDKPTALRSARALRALEPTALAPGHGPIVTDPGAAMDRAIAKAA